jgi:CRISPR/Cas system-associated exonuclease Cas4 (RecB family)
MNIEHISVSREGVWQECKLKYKYKYHLKIPEGKEAFHFTYGKLIHKCAEEYVGLNGEKSINEIALDVLQGKIPIERGKDVDVFAPSLPPAYQARMPGHLRSLKTITDQVGMGGELEYHFNYDLDPPNKKYIKGFIDRIIRRNDEWFILDYKTTKKGKWRKDSKSILHDLQLRMYARVIQKEFDVSPDKIRCALYYLEGGDLLAAKYSQESIIEAEQHLLNVYNNIIEMPPDAAQGNVGDHCFFCPYKSRCPAYNRI